MIDALIITMVVLAFMQPSKDRADAALVFAILTMIHNIAFSNLDGFYYYGSAAFFDLMIIYFTSKLSISKLTMSIHKICLVSIFLNYIGWVMWMLYYPPTAYNYSYYLLYGWSIIMLIKRDVTYAGVHTMDNRGADLSRHPTSGHNDHGQGKSAA